MVYCKSETASITALTLHWFDDCNVNKTVQVICRVCVAALDSCSETASITALMLHWFDDCNVNKTVQVICRVCVAALDSCRFCA